MNIRKNKKITQLSICQVNDESVKNYMIIVEYKNNIPKHSYIVDMHGFKYTDQEQPYYVFNDN